MADDAINEDQKTEEKKSAASGNIKLIIAGIVIIIICAALSFGVAMFAANNFTKAEAPKGDGYGKVKSETIGTTYDAGEFITNLDKADSNRYIKVKIVFAFQDPKVQEEIAAKLPQIQHTINSTLRQQTPETLAQSKAMEKLADLLKKNVNSFLINGNINSVYFTSFVVQ